MLGLKGTSTGLIQSATAALGSAAVVGPPAVAATGMYLAMEDGAVDYSYAASGSTSKLADALTAYENW